MGAVTAIKRCFFPLNVPVCTWSMVDDMNLYGLTGWSSLYASRWAWLMCIDWQLTQVEVTFCSNNSSDCFKDETAQCPAEFRGLPQPETRLCFRLAGQKDAPVNILPKFWTFLQVWIWWINPSRQQHQLKRSTRTIIVVIQVNKMLYAIVSDMLHCLTLSRKKSNYSCLQGTEVKYLFIDVVEHTFSSRLNAASLLLIYYTTTQ